MNHLSTLLNTSRFLAASLLVFGLAGAGTLPDSDSATSTEEYKVMSMKDDLAHRSHDIHWPTGFEPEKADLFAHNDLIINASCERVWAHIIDASQWPTWYPNSKDVEIQGGGSGTPRWRGVPVGHVRLGDRKQSARVCIEPAPGMVRLRAGSQAELLSFLVSGA
jgi:hypothetical protein